MQTKPAPTRIDAAGIAAVITAAAENHPEPVTPKSLMDLALSKIENHKRANLNSLVAHRLHYAHCMPICRIARAYKVEGSTIRHRIAIATRIMHQSPWREIYQQLP